jgi:FkbH-like protein
MVKCVIWDLDNTLLSGVFLESAPQPPAADLAMLATATQLGGRGIIHAVASKNPPEAAEHAAKVTGLQFAAAECGWGRKSESVQRIITDLNLAADAVAFVDDDPYERAEVSFALPDVLVLAPEDMNDAVGWPEFSPGQPITPEARRRGEMYAARRCRHAEARAFAGSPGEFAAYSAAKLTIARATAADVPRLHELSVRTHQFNSRGEAVAEAALAAMVASPAHRVATVRLSDRFGDDGMVGASVAGPGVSDPETGGRTWTVELLMMSCRAMGRGVIEALLSWLVRSAARDGAGLIAVPCLISPRNVPLRLALTGAGFRAGPGSQPGRPAMFSRQLPEPLTEPLTEPLPGWVTAPEDW